ncbi:WD repeat, SAM and U-box domain-containing protein 1-like isoform X2 [Harmonia axyridis]|nr:WD repeat, SAM and U-box domain-containing protein 1-like isoform X2 [Harmonia axyridis]XP_045483234.1 WD repeat, SAM and U-box domain-containing protein 1-like isoform X2 [Harmonia axyridis]XP_045483235.1 WD repeat, SAM and U-box domain-containing protein 1-like isoform X2 [Harmonia axyridis]XP_045483236.1 WD repeat, SAM and U-box domain-containing protein 1-like isoform X2 [Harmonia axyridis]XP_045483237.1 WD repeat, SAM and U-box domain-containing protein 1-like isoform X2 [Harmonia axyri
MSCPGQDVKILQKVLGHKSDVTTCDFAANCTLVTGSGDKTVRVWDWVPGTGYVERSNSPLKDHKYNVTCVQASPQGFMFASASVDGTAILWNVSSLDKIYTMAQVNGDPIRVCRFSPDSAIFVTAGDNGAVCIWDLARRNLIRTVWDHKGATQSLAFTPDSMYLVTACSMEMINVWHVQDLVDTVNEACCSPAASLVNALDMGVLSLDVSKRVEVEDDNPLQKQYTLASSGSTNEIKIWNITSVSFPKGRGSGQRVTVSLHNVLEGHSSSVTCVRYTPGGETLVSCSLDKTIKVWDNLGGCIAQLHGHARYVNCVAVSKDSSFIASGKFNRFLYYRTVRFDVWTLTHYLLVGSNDRQVIVWDLNGNLSLDCEIVKHQKTNGSSDYVHSEVHVSQNVDNMQLLEKIDDLADGSINSCCFHPNGLLVIGSGDKSVKLFSLNEEHSLNEVPYSPLEGHTYAVNHLDISKDGSKLATCSQDGCAFIWDPETGDKIGSLPTSSLSIKVCKFSPDGEMLVTAGDDEKAFVWNADTMENIATLEGHLDAITCACFTPDCAVLVTTCFNEDFRLWNCCDNFRLIHVEEDVHTTGIQSCDFSTNLEPIPNVLVADQQTYLLATCGNDSVAKLWCVTVPKKRDLPSYDEVNVKIWRSLYGHGGSLTCIKFSPCLGEIVCSTATDRQARLWSVYSGECLYVLDHNSIVTTCSFTDDCTLLSIGCIDKSLWLWKLPSQLVFQTAVVNKTKQLSKNLYDWSTTDVSNWLENIGLNEIKVNALNASLDGRKMVTFSEEEICSALDIVGDDADSLAKEIRWLKQGDSKVLNAKREDIPYDFLCPITHEVMVEPVVCSDGFTYERRAITEWFMAGKYTSPMTNEPLVTTAFKLNNELRNSIRSFLDLEE